GRSCKYTRLRLSACIEILVPARPLWKTLASSGQLCELSDVCPGDGSVHGRLHRYRGARHDPGRGRTVEVQHGTSEIARLSIRVDRQPGCDPAAQTAELDEVFASRSVGRNPKQVRSNQDRGWLRSRRGGNEKPEHLHG